MRQESLASSRLDVASGRKGRLTLARCTQTTHHEMLLLMGVRLQRYITEDIQSTEDISLPSSLRKALSLSFFSLPPSPSHTHFKCSFIHTCIRPSSGHNSLKCSCCVGTLSYVTFMSIENPERESISFFSVLTTSPSFSIKETVCKWSCVWREKVVTCEPTYVVKRYSRPSCRKPKQQTRLYPTGR